MNALARSAVSPWVLALVSIGLLGSLTAGDTPLPVPRVIAGPSPPLALFLTTLPASAAVAVVCRPLTPAELMSHRHIHLRLLVLCLGITVGVFIVLLLAARSLDDQLHLAAARTFLGHVGAGLLARTAVGSAAPAVPIVAGILVPVVSNAQSAPLLSWVIRPEPDASTWAVSLVLLLAGVTTEALVQHQ